MCSERCFRRRQSNLSQPISWALQRLQSLNEGVGPKIGISLGMQMRSSVNENLIGQSRFRHLESHFSDHLLERIGPNLVESCGFQRAPAWNRLQTNRQQAALGTAPPNTDTSKKKILNSVYASNCKTHTVRLYDRASIRFKVRISNRSSPNESATQQFLRRPASALDRKRLDNCWNALFAFEKLF